MYPGNRGFSDKAECKTFLETSTPKTRAGRRMIPLPPKMEGNMMDYILHTADIFSGMRLIVERATIGKALYDLRQSVIDLEDACHEETKRQSLSKV